ncbi:pullulanase [Paenibacillus luteus]|uniref:pullulanase n=1 Tax=Paenibacillus luteus TaxID=2545753 RepID=UPI001143964B|nr:pullulanase [Paenibacillus luteus]
MSLVFKQKRLLSMLLIAVMLWSVIGIYPIQASAETLPRAVLVGDLQSELGHTGDWDPAAEATEMDSLGNGYYSLTGILPAGTYEYKIAIDGAWAESYGFASYTNPSGVDSGGNIKLVLTEETEITFYYNHITHKIADSTYYTPIAADKLPRIVGSLQTAIGDPGNWQPEAALSILDDQDFDNVYTITKKVPQGTYEYKLALGSNWDEAYPAQNLVLALPEELPVTFQYHAGNHEVKATFTVPVDPNADPIPANHLRVHYSRADGLYEQYGLWLWDHVASPSANWPSGATVFPAGKADAYGAYVDIPLAAVATKIGFLIVNRTDGSKDGGDKAITLAPPEKNEIWIQQGLDKVYDYEPVELPENTVRIHYVRADQNQSAYGLWLWDQVAVPSEGWPAGAAAFEAGNVDRYGGYTDIQLQPNAQKISFLVVNRTSGDKDGGDRTFSLLDRYDQLWIREGDNTVYVSPYWEMPTGLVFAEILSESKLLLSFTMTDGLAAAELKSAISITDKNGASVAVKQVTLNADKKTALVEVDIQLEQAPLQVTYQGKTVSAATGWRMLDEVYAYEGDDLGATYADGQAVLKLWAPTASSVVVNVYDKNDATQLVGSKSLANGSQGVWSAALAPEDLSAAGVSDVKGYFYQYEVTNDGVTKQVLDPYAKSMAEFRVNTKGEAGPDGDMVGKAAIVDLSQTDPAADFDFAQIDGYEKREDAIIWEAHIRDFTSDPSIASDLNARWGSYSAFKDKLDYIKSLGVTHVQLLPVMAWYYGDEAAMGVRETEYSALDNEYNWGYDPHSYFSPDGAYSENASDPELRVKELKDLVDAIHEAGMGVVLDVVYTHMAKASFLNDIVPNYYAFQDANGNNIGGFGNNLATSHKMAEKLMVDSVKYWFEEYKIDGMRWDMMGDATYNSVQNAYDAAASINPNALFIGEGWKTFGGAAADPSLEGKGADQAWMDKTDNVGVFSDEIRNELKSGYGSEGEPRFITGGARSIATILDNIKAQPGNTPADDPGDMVQYIEAHDNLPLYDVIAQSIKKDPSIAANDLEIHKRVRLGNLLILTSQGTAFLHAGQEYGRTKQWLGAGVPEQKYHELADEDGNPFGYFIHDSYDSSDAINKFDWQKAADEVQYPVNHITKEYTAGLIALRKHTDAFRLGDKDLVDSNVTLIPSVDIKANDLVIGYKNKATDGSGNYYVFVNADSKPRTLALSEDLTAGTVLVDNDEAGLGAVTVPSGFELAASSITLEPLSAVIIKLDAAAPTLTSLELDSASYTLQVGSTHQTAVFAKYSDGSKRKVTGMAAYSTDHPDVIAVSSSGVVTASGAGAATVTVTYQGATASAAVSVTTESTKRYVQLNYIRPDKNYTVWNLWIWNTGVKNDQINFDKVENGVATVMLEISPDTTSVGFVLRKGTDWNTAKQDIPDDRVILIAPGAAFTKVNITSMVSQLDILPVVNGPVLKDGTLTFLYRDDVLFREGRLGDITVMKVKVNGMSYDMVYDAAKEWFAYTLHDIEGGVYEYTFLVTKKNAEAVEMTDPKNTTDGKSAVTYRKPSVTMSAAASPASISYNESAVLTIEAAASEEIAYAEGYMDLTALGGPAKAAFDTGLMAQTIGVKDSITAGVKEIPITLVDEYGNKHTHKGSITVKARTYAGKLDFDWDEARIYFALTDRFADGDSSNNADVDKSHLEAYHGGDFRGMIDKLDYLEELGINTLWITPIVDNIDFNKGVDFNSKQYGYHGYWAKDFTKLDEHLGDMDTFKELINKAHDKGIKIMVDVVLNHTGYGLKPEENRPGITAEDKARFDGMLRTNGVQASTNPIEGELDHLPDFKTEDPAVREKIIEWQAGWLERARTERGDTIDFFRVDTVKHVESTTWKAFKNALTTIDPGFKLIGEYYGATIDGDGGMLRSGQMDSLLDFSFNDRARDFVNGAIDAVDAYLADREAKLDNGATMGQFLSSHDEDGFLSHFVDGDKGKLKIAAALQITAKGQPVIYYGEELGRSGANARDMSAGLFSENRADMPWDQLEAEQALHDHYQKLLSIRAKFSKVYAKGARTKLAGSDELGYLAFNKQYEGDNVVTIINTSTASKLVTLTVPFPVGAEARDEYSGKLYTVAASGELTVEVPGRNEGGTVILSAVAAVQPTPSPTTEPTATPEVTPSPTTVPTSSPEVTPSPTTVPTSSPEATPSPTTVPTSSPEVTPSATTGPTSSPEATPSPTSPTTTPGTLPTPNGSGTTQQPTDAQVVEESTLKSGKDGKVTVQVADGKRAVLLPLHAATMLASNALALEANSVTITLSNEVLAELQALAAGNEANDARILLEFKPLTAAETNELMERLGTDYIMVDAASEIYDFHLSLWTKDGKVVKVTKFASPITLTFKLHADADKDKVGIYFMGENGKLEYHGGLLSGSTISAEVNHFSSYAALAYERSFADVPTSHWASAAIKSLAAKHIVTGLNDTQFAPQAQVTRAEFVAMLVRALGAKAEGKANFSDVDADHWYSSYVATASKLGLVKGRSGSSFAPNDTITREEMVVMVMRAYEVSKGKENVTAANDAGYADSSQISHWAIASIARASELELVQGIDGGSFMPKGKLTRAESAQVIYNLLSK